jgi:hypothetical protein
MRPGTGACAGIARPRSDPLPMTPGLAWRAPRLGVRHPEVVATARGDVPGSELDTTVAAGCRGLPGRGLPPPSSWRRCAPAYLLGEIVKGDYRRWTGPGLLDGDQPRCKGSTAT